MTTQETTFQAPYSIGIEVIGAHTFYVPLRNGEHIAKAGLNPFGKKYALYDKRKNAVNFLLKQGALVENAEARARRQADALQPVQDQTGASWEVR